MLCGVVTLRKSYFEALSHADMLSFQCSPLSTADGIIRTFQQCDQLQQNNRSDKYVAVVVLDNIGLAEDSSKMPLKALHPLLEDGCVDEEISGDNTNKKVGFIGISNWALDPAKMNRGLHVERGDPDESELELIAKGICSVDKKVKSHMSMLFTPLAKGYIDIFHASVDGREYFGLRDYFCMIKLLYVMTQKKHDGPLGFDDIKYAIRRNFSGVCFEEDPLQYFVPYLKDIFGEECAKESDTLDRKTALRVIEDALEASVKFCEIQRYSLFLTESYSGLRLLYRLLNVRKEQGASTVKIIHGSSFPRDLEYTRVCRDINRIKVSMEKGYTLLLMNMDQLYESLYDVLNQYYTPVGNENFVDLGLGTHRLKCKVHENFKLIVLADRRVVLEQFPIPLINRLEKHILYSHLILNDQQNEIRSQMDNWMNQYCSSAILSSKQNSFVGYHTDTVPLIVEDPHENFEQYKRQLLQLATPDSIIRLDQTALQHQKSHPALNLFL